MLFFVWCQKCYGIYYQFEWVWIQLSLDWSIHVLPFIINIHALLIYIYICIYIYIYNIQFSCCSFFPRIKTNYNYQTLSSAELCLIYKELLEFITLSFAILVIHLQVRDVLRECCIVRLQLFEDRFKSRMQPQRKERFNDVNACMEKILISVRMNEHKWIHETPLQEMLA